MIKAMFDFYLWCGATVEGVIIGMIFVSGRLRWVKDSLFAIGALFFWPLYIPYILRRIK